MVSKNRTLNQIHRKINVFSTEQHFFCHKSHARIQIISRILFYNVKSDFAFVRHGALRLKINKIKIGLEKTQKHSHFPFKSECKQCIQFMWCSFAPLFKPIPLKFQSFCSGYGQHMKLQRGVSICTLHWYGCASQQSMAFMYTYQ